MKLSVNSDDIEEVRRALSSAHREVIRELGRGCGVGGGPEIQLCRRKWTLEAMLRQLDDVEGLPAPLEVIPRRENAGLEQVAARQLRAA